MSELMPIERYEILAHAFHAMTGYMAPGKDSAAAANSPHSLAERQDAWRRWSEKHGDINRAMLNAFDAIMGDDHDR